MTSGTRVALPLHCGQANVTSSTKGRCGSIAKDASPASAASSLRPPIQVKWFSSQRQIGSGVPQ